MAKFQTKPPDLIVCKGCGHKREHHAHGYCGGCYAKAGYAQRRQGICANFQDVQCRSGTDIVEIVGRGLCSSCWQRLNLQGQLYRFPKLTEQAE